MSKLSDQATRRHFLASAAVGSAALVGSTASWAASGSAQLQNPYAGLDWASTKKVGSGTHMHCRSQRVLEILYRRGLRHFAISNYYPSAPCSDKEHYKQYWVEQNFGTIKGQGYTNKTFRWNEIMSDPKSGWINDLPEEIQKQMPFKVGPPLFADLPEDVIICPNAEHHSSTDSGGHFNSVGSTFSSGNFDIRGKHHLHQHDYPVGLGIPWKEAFQRVFDGLQFADGGGVTINHPIWSGLKTETIYEMLDFDPRVLGIEIWNQTCEQLNNKGWGVDRWDEILKTGRRCFGFSVSDHAHSNNPNFLGYNVLFLDEKTPAEKLPQACLQAYRNGQFYCTLIGDIHFESIQCDGETLQVKTDLPCQLRLISAQGVVHQQQGTELSYRIPADPAGRKQHLYLRIEADQLDGKDRIFSQPILLG